MKYKRWTKEEDIFLIKNNSHMSNKQLAVVMNRTRGGVNHRRLVLGIKKIEPIKIGETFNFLTVIAESPKKSHKGERYVLCKCYCGKEKDILSRCLRNNNTKSCGCTSSLLKSEGVASWTLLYNTYKKDARNKNRTFTLSIENYIDICCLSCHYCGERPIKFNCYVKNDGKPRNRQYLSIKCIGRAWIEKNGIDRVDSDIGYEPNNCVPCCEKCNKMKMEENVSDFLNHVKKINSFQNSKGK